jgi:hypothetical protein
MSDSPLKSREPIGPGLPEPRQPPTGFNPIDASNEDLLNYGFPPRPDPQKAPLQYAKWRRPLSRARERVSLSNTKPTPAQPPREESTTWSGALLDTSIAPRPTEQELSFWSVSALWTVPNPYPPPDAKDEQVYTNRNWVGFDGYSDACVYRAGTTSRVVKSGDTITRSVVAFFEYLNTDPVEAEHREYPELPVAPGDIISSFVFGVVGSSRVFALIINLGSGQYIQDQLTTGPALTATSCEWILESILSPAGKELGFADYVTDLYDDILAFNLILDFKSRRILDSFNVYTVKDAKLLEIKDRSTPYIPYDAMVLYAHDRIPPSP